MKFIIELLYNNSLSIDGKKIIEETRFNYEIPEVTDVKLKEIIDDFIKLNLCPARDQVYIYTFKFDKPFLG